MSALLAIQKLSAPHDVNGNPRRCFVIYDTSGGIAQVIDGGYRYSHVPQEFRDLPDLGEIKVSASEYNSFMRIGRELEAKR